MAKWPFLSSKYSRPIYVPRSNQIIKDNLDHNPSSTAAHGSFHENCIRILAYMEHNLSLKWYKKT